MSDWIYGLGYVALVSSWIYLALVLLGIAPYEVIWKEFLGCCILFIIYMGAQVSREDLSTTNGNQDPEDKT
jgi:hypothetical protein